METLQLFHITPIQDPHLSTVEERERIDGSEHHDFARSWFRKTRFESLPNAACASQTLLSISFWKVEGRSPVSASSDGEGVRDAVLDNDAACHLVM